jgi:hypothetical protein
MNRSAMSVQGFQRRDFAKEVAEEMERQRPTTTTKQWVTNGQLEVNVDGYVVLTMRTNYGLVVDFRLHPKVAQRNNPADYPLIESARDFFNRAFDTVARRWFGFEDRTPEPDSSTPLVPSTQ